MTTDSVTAEIKPRSDKLSAECEQLSSQLADLISPFSEVMGAAGDHMKIWRKSSVVEKLAVAHRKAVEREIDIRPVAPKTLVHWAEKASLEDDVKLSGKWANLLLRSMGDEFEASSVWATDILAELGAPEAKVLDDIYRLLPSSLEICDIANLTQQYEIYQKYEERSLIGKLRLSTREFPYFTRMRTLRDFNKTTMYLNTATVSTKTEEAPLKWEVQMSEHFGRGRNIQILDFLIAKGLVSRISRTIEENDIRVSATGAYLTSLGVIFMRLVSEPSRHALDLQKTIEKQTEKWKSGVNTHVIFNPLEHSGFRDPKG